MFCPQCARFEPCGRLGCWLRPRQDALLRALVQPAAEPERKPEEEVQHDQGS
jgi:hypothetical protein